MKSQIKPRLSAEHVAHILRQYSKLVEEYNPRFKGVQRMDHGELYALIDETFSQELVDIFCNHPFGQGYLLGFVLAVDGMRELMLEKGIDPSILALGGD